MTSYYATPAAANYYTPSAHAHRQRGARLCDQCGSIEQPTIKQFRLCGGCMTTNYCSPECQKLHWPSHKAICQHTAAQISASKQQPISVDYPDENLAKLLRKFTSLHSALLGWAGFQALQLKRVPANVRQHALLVELSYRPTSDRHRQFVVKGTHIVPRTYVTGRDPLVAAEIQQRDERCRRNGGIGAAVVLIQCGGISQVMPVEVDPPSKITWDNRDDWDDVLRHFVDSGRVDFKPISTTSRGVYYG
ncbi:hypothetical protein EW146_g3844 [Bondarzewia mesenterica]|uniref:MYND-type domain-containing protein n=1 Tax=Bondarzewia mesenterica TaxID=1095465 RepID=A0A4S4LWC2_9AGAM|nr:hypothetical protein EW146_g3844 [Bondarzewia mesenterica]